uniref:Uncharacterized protein n=1 Tax=Salix viminalis TaxID=40686 RepID=A0A6N2MS60_SALVM
MPLKQRMSLHASVLIGRTYHGVPEFHGLLIGSRVPKLNQEDKTPRIERDAGSEKAFIFASKERGTVR